MNGLTEFLLARIAEDEAVAAACPPWPWRVAVPEDEKDDDRVTAHDVVVAADGILVAEPFALSGNQQRQVMWHIARHDPARVLAECEAKRRIVAEHEVSPLPTLGLLALPYADHPDYREEWRP